MWNFLKFFTYKHPLLNFIFQDPQDPIKGLMRRAVILSTFTLTFTLTIINDHVFFDGTDTTNSDLSTLVHEHEMTKHLGVTLVISAFISVVAWWNEFLYKMTTWKCMQYPCCYYFKGSLYFEALWVFLFNALLYGLVLRSHSELFVGWIFSYLLYCGIVVPVMILVSYFLLGGKERMRLQELEQNGNYHHRLVDPSAAADDDEPNAASGSSNYMTYA